MAEKHATRQLILEAAIDCIEKYGLENVTTRRIAQQAGTNIASINYHFRSKDELLAETLALTSKHMLEDVLRTLETSREPFEATLREVFRYLLEGSWRFPGMSRAHLSQAIMTGRRDSAGARAMIKIFDRLAERAAEAYPRKYKEVLHMRLAQVMCSILFLVLSPDFFGIMTGKRMSKAEQAQLYASSFATLFIRSI
jgi:AcrR family transcriptional regulator